MAAGHAHLARVARESFGYEHLRPGQAAAVQSLLEGQDTLAVMPTGSGKSAIYGLAAQLLDGPVVIVSPLIALQRDQVEALEELDAGDAALLNSTLHAEERRNAVSDLESGDLAFLFLAPEQFANDETLESLRAAAPVLFVVDEAHCISEWGHDFRPDYLRLGAVVERLGHPTVLALTATAAPPVREEIVERLGMRDPRVIVRGFDRPNIWLGVESFNDERTKRRALLDRVAEAATPGIVYTATRRHAEEVADALVECGVGAVAYHAGLTASRRAEIQDAFMADEYAVIVATIAFGMGIDKPNVRFVFHHDVSDSVDAYYQEIGRAGRDGEPARAILFYRPEDLALRRFFAGSGQVDLDQVEQVVTAVRAHDSPMAPRELRAETGLSQSKLAGALSRLEEIGAIQMLPDGAVAPGAREDDVDEIAAQVVRASEQRQAYQQSRIEMMRGYAEVLDCRREYLLNYFGEVIDDPCGYCDNCEAGIVVADDEGAEPFPLSSRVRHVEWGEGLVHRYEGDKMIVLFDSVGYKTLAVDLVVENDLLRGLTENGQG